MKTSRSIDRNPRGFIIGAILGVGLIAIPLVTVAAFVGGALAAAPPAVLKATRGTHEVINTMMMNFIIGAVVSWLVGKLRSSPETVHTPPIPEA